MQRELLEEIGAIVTKPILLCDMYIEWTPEWTENEPKRLERYKQFRGERAFVLLAYLKSTEKPTSTEQDQWPGGVSKNLYSPASLYKQIDKTIDK